MRGGPDGSSSRIWGMDSRGLRIAAVRARKCTFEFLEAAR